MIHRTVQLAEISSRQRRFRSRTNGAAAEPYDLSTIVEPKDEGPADAALLSIRERTWQVPIKALFDSASICDTQRRLPNYVQAPDAPIGYVKVVATCVPLSDPFVCLHSTQK